MGFLGKSKESKRVNRDAENEYTKINSGYDRFNSGMWDRIPGAQNRADETYDYAFKGYKDLFGGEDGTGQIDDLINSFGGGGGFGDLEGSFMDLYNTGGLTDENRRRIRGDGVFDEYAKTGGLDENARQTLRAKGTATLPQFYQNLRNELESQARASGGKNVGYDSQMAAMGRDEARGTQDAATAVEADIIDRVTEGRKWGASSMSGAELGLGNLEGANKRAGLSGAFNARQAGLGRGDAINEAKLRALGLKGDILDSIRGLRTDVPGEENALYSHLRGGLGDRAGAAAGNINQRMQYNPNKGFMENLGGLVNGLGPLAASLMGPGGMLTKLKGPAKLPSATNNYSKMFSTNNWWRN